MPVVVYNPGMRSPSGFGSAVFNRVTLKPGKNTISKDELISLRNHPEFNSFESQGVVLVIPELKEDNEVLPLPKSSVQPKKVSSLSFSEINVEDSNQIQSESTLD